MEENNNMQSSMPEAPKEKSSGALIGAIIIILILIIGGIYLIGQSQSDSATEGGEAMEQDSMIGPDESLSTSDDLESIENDLDGQADFEDLDQDL